MGGVAGIRGKGFVRFEGSLSHLYAGEVGEYAGLVGEYAGEVGEYAGLVGE